ncbi:Nramp family divalent metal transporter [Phenylobacterium sp.]|uniref:Nramp family divalent metal transporter n=1 Tax=Phenylobacterium sp. TaxID=1871053 RepID=UPI002F41A366
MPPPPEFAATATLPLGAAAPLRRPRAGAGALRRIAAAAGPGYLVAVGSMDPGNWANGLAGGSAFGYRLLSLVVLANVMAMALQAMAARLGIATGQDLAQACRARYGPAVRTMLWLLCEIAIITCDLAEVLGAAIALQLLFHLPLVAGIALLAAGQNATLTSTLAGQIVLEGFTTFRIAPWARRLVSRGLAIVPAAAIAWLYGAAGVGQLLVAGQVVLSL